MAVGTISPRSLIASTPKVSARLARVISGRRRGFTASASRRKALRAPCSAADVGHFYFALLRRFRGADFGVAVVARAPHRGNRRADVRVGLALTQQGAKIVAGSREQAGVEHALGGNAGAGAGAAERLGHRGDDADLARAVAI